MKTLVHSVPWQQLRRCLLTITSLAMTVSALSEACAELPACCGGDSLRNYYAPMTNGEFGYWRTQWRPWSVSEMGSGSFHGTPALAVPEPPASPYQPGHSWLPAEQPLTPSPSPAPVSPVPSGASPHIPLPPPPAQPHPSQPGAVNPMSWQLQRQHLPADAGQQSRTSLHPGRTVQQRPAIRLRHPREAMR